MGVFIGFEYLQQPCESVNSFERSTKALVHLLAGPFVHTEMLVATPTESTMFTIHLGGVFCKAPYDPVAHKNFTFLSLSTSPDEELKILKTCEACVSCKIKYNTRDMLLHAFPFRNPEERGLMQAPSLYCAQSMVLILRECLESVNPLLRQIDPSNLHSRTVTPSSLYELIHPLCLLIPSGHVLCLGPRCACITQESGALKPAPEAVPKHRKEWDSW
jgi:hypothetical protein